MDWVFDHLQILILVAVAVAAALQKIKRGRDQQTAAPPAMDPGEAERTRRIQEEIRRRIMERRGAAAAQPPPAEEEAPAFPEAPPMIEEVRPVVVAPPVLVPVDAAPMPDYSLEAERQRQMLARLRELESAKRQRARSAPAAADGAGVTTPVSAPASGLRAMLRGPAGMRQAIVLREIVDAPLGLRPPEAPGQGSWTRS